MTTLQTRTMVRECKDGVLAAMLLHGDQHQLQTIYLCLDEAEDHLASAAVGERIAELQSVQEKLLTITNTINQNVEELRELFGNIKKVANALKILTDVGKQAASLCA